MNHIVTIEQAQAEFREIFTNNLDLMTDLELVDFQFQMMYLFNEDPTDWLTGNRRMAYTAGVGQLCLWMEEYIADNRDLEDAREQWEGHFDDCLCDECRLKMEQEKEDLSDQDDD